MSAIAIAVVPGSPVVPPMPVELLEQVETLRRGGSRFPGSGEGDPGLALRAPAPVFHPAAPAALAAIEARLGPANEVVIAPWLIGLSMVVHRRPPDEEMQPLAGLMLSVCRDLPAGVWCEETLLEAQRTFHFWPSAAQVYTLLKPHADRLAGTRIALYRIVKAASQPAAPKPPERPPVDDRAIAAVSKLVQSFVAERSEQSTAAPADERRWVPKRMSDRQLLAMYEKAAAGGDEAARARVARLRARLGAADPGNAVPG